MKLKKFLCYLLATVTMFSVGCGNPSGQQDTWEVGNIKLWAAPSYVKIYQDIDYSQQNEYSAF